MATKKRGIDASALKAMARAFDLAQDGDSKSAWVSAGAKILALLKACASADDVERVLRAHRRVFEVEGSLYPCPQAVDVLFERIGAMGGEEAGRSLGWLSLASAPPDLVARPLDYPGLRDPLKNAARSAVEEHIAELRVWIRDESPERRAGSTYLLGLCTNATSKDAGTLLQGTDSDRNPAASATALLAAGVILRRSNEGEARARCHSRAEGRLADKSPLVRVCAAAAVALVADSVSERAVKVLAEHIDKPVAVPPEWGWITAKPPSPRTDDLALRLLSWIRSDAPDAAVDALAAKPVAKLSQNTAGLVRDALVHMGVEATQGRVRPTELVGNELDARARKALSSVADGRFTQAHVDGWKLLPTYAIAGLLAEKAVEWRPLEIEVGGEKRRWSFNRIFSGVVLGEIAAEGALDVLTRSLAPDDLVGLITRATSIYSPLEDATLRNAEACEREQRFALAVLEKLAAQDYDLERGFHVALTADGILATRVAAAILTFHPREVPAEYVPLVADAISATGSAEPLQSLLAALPPGVRRSILHHEDANAGGAGAWPIWGANLDDVTVSKIVKHLIFEDRDRKHAFEIFKRGGERVARLLESVKFDNKMLQSKAAPVIRAAVKAIRGGK
jgi:hypothetical protein